MANQKDDYKPSSWTANGLIILALALRSVDLIPPLARAMLPYVALYRLITILSVLAVLVLERRHLNRLYISRYHWRNSLSWGFLFGSLLGFSVGLVLAWTRFGFHWLSWIKIPPTLGMALTTAIFEELMYRSYVLSRLAETRMGPVWANITQTILFVAVHPRYFVQGTWFMIAALTIFAFVTGILTLRTRNIAGAIAAHAGLDLLVFVPIGGVVVRL
jgi:membrane protease YdiL (CAAX protease family)